MGTRDDEYDYLFKGAAKRVQTGEGAAERQRTGGPKLRFQAFGPRPEPGAWGRDQADGKEGGGWAW